MAVFKCKMCGGSLSIENNERVATCEFCGTKQTLPNLSDEKRANRYDRANYLRRGNEFDKASAIYEQILSEDKEDSEAYWSIVLCRYGVEYVEDPKTHKRVPTINRAQYESIYNDADYLAAIKYADNSQKEIYEDEARVIDEIQRGILEISNKESPFDIFICYKESDNQGRRTEDSVLAQNLYKELTAEGYNVFFSRVTLEDKLGVAYEPYIFAALNSAKVMIVVGTNKENLESVWVKNEWSRYLSLIEKGNKKTLIPAYKDMNPYDLPEEFAYLQALDMSKIGFTQDLLHGINKLIVKKNVFKETGVNTDSLIKRGFMFLEDNNPTEADRCFEKVLDADPENSNAYLGKLMIDLHVTNQEDLGKQEKLFFDNPNYHKAMKYADENAEQVIKSYINRIVERKANEIHNRGNKILEMAVTDGDCKLAYDLFRRIEGFRDANDMMSKCIDKAIDLRKDKVYQLAQENARDSTINGYTKAINMFAALDDYKASKEYLEETQLKLNALQVRKGILRGRIKKFSIIGAACAALIGLTVYITKTNEINEIKDAYSNAVTLYQDGKYEEAIKAFKEFEGIEDIEEVKGYADYIKNAEHELKLIGINEELKKHKVGDTFNFGTYNARDVEWQVIAQDEKKMLVITTSPLEIMAYNTNKTKTTWEESDIRTWLNNEFVGDLFEDEDYEKHIIKSKISTPNNEKQKTEGGADTDDKVFLLSIKEVEEYFKEQTDRVLKDTNEIIESKLKKDGTCLWWLRDPGAKQKVVYVDYTGKIVTNGELVTSKKITVRPAMYISYE